MDWGRRKYGSRRRTWYSRIDMEWLTMADIFAWRADVYLATGPGDCGILPNEWDGWWETRADFEFVHSMMTVRSNSQDTRTRFCEGKYLQQEALCSRETNLFEICSTSNVVQLGIQYYSRTARNARTETSGMACISRCEHSGLGLLAEQQVKPKACLLQYIVQLNRRSSLLTWGSTPATLADTTR